MSRDISEFKSKLTKQGYNLCLPLGASLPTALKAFGFALGQDVVVRGLPPGSKELPPGSFPDSLVKEEGEPATRSLAHSPNTGSFYQQPAPI